MVLIKNKKGVFFTIFVIVIISLFILGYSFTLEYKDRKTTKNRITTLNNFIFSFEEDMPRQLYISAFRIIFLLEKDIIKTGNFIPDINDAFEEAFYNGTILGKSDTEIQTIMGGATFEDIKIISQEKAKKINANITIIPYSISLTHENPWELNFTLNANIFIKDLNNLAVWNKTESISTLIPVEGFEDPIYITNTNGLVTNKIIKTPYTVFVSGTNIQNLSSHSQNSYYLNSTEAPSFLNRLEGDLSSDPNGIESLVNLADLTAQAIPLEDKSVVDHIYFSTSNPAACNVVPAGMPSWFKLDNAHLPYYQVSCA